MARVSFVEKEQAEPRVKELYQELEKAGREITNLFKVMGHCPFIGRSFLQMGGSIRHGEELPANLRELAILRVGNLTGSGYEFARHTPIALGVGVRQKQIEEISNWKASPEFTEEECAILAYTDEVTLDVEVKDETFSRLRNHFKDQVIVELTIAIGYYCMVCRLLIALRIELEEDFY